MDVFKPLPKSMTDSVIELWLDTMSKSHPYIDYSYMKQKSAIIKKGLQGDIRALICTHNGEIAGFIMINSDNRVESIVVGSAHQKRGLGTRLLKYAQSRYKTLHMNVYARDKNALRFYSSHGFLISGAVFNHKVRLLEYTMIWSAE